mmetsp:Transcript_32185/g.67666  ORF Transcript_32185/g.67666 Transcript_32185/m.67666 type:complete len:3523 (+) Transcript_32185:112-10680(+)
MGPPPITMSERISSRKGREDAIETLLDMDPNGAAYRVARTMNGALTSALQGRSNRIPDAALFDAAHALGRYEITLDSPAVLDLYAPPVVNADAHAHAKDETAKQAETAYYSSTTTAGEQREENMEKVLKEGWQTRILRHHDKIIRAKNHANPIKPTAVTARATSATGNPNKKTCISTSTNVSKNAIPPPALISALRQIFGSVSNSSDLQDLLLDEGGMGNSMDEQSGRPSKESVNNTLPSLLKAVLNHNVFTGTSSIDGPLAMNDRISSSGGTRRMNIKRDWKSMFDTVDGSSGENKQEDDGDGRSDGGNDSVATSHGEGGDDGDGSMTDAITADGEGTLKNGEEERIPPAIPAAANLECILGNACRDMLNHSDGTNSNSRVHGLLIAALSVMTDRLFSPEDLENLNFLGSEQQQQQLGEEIKDGSTTVTSVTLDSTNETTDPFANVLQVGALLSTLSNSTGSEEEEMKEFTLDDQLLQYFVNASSTYEERIEVQKANLFRSTTPIPMATPKDTPKDKKQGKKKRSASPTVASLLLGGSPPPLGPPGRNSNEEMEEVKTSDDSDDDSDDVPNIDNVVSASMESMPELISRRRSSRDPTGSRSRSMETGLSEAIAALGETAGDMDASALLQHIVDIVAAADAEEEENGPGEEDSDDGIDEMAVEINSSEEMDVEVDEEDDDHDHDIDEGEHEEDDNDSEELEEENDDDELQRALALSLAAAIGAGSSDDSDSDDGSSQNSEDGDSNASDATTEAAAGSHAATRVGGAATDTTSTTTPAAATSTPAPPLGEMEKQSETTSQNQKNDANMTTPLPPLPTLPPISLLPNYNHQFDTRSESTSAEAENEESTEGVKLNADADLSAVFEPSALSSFGKVPASHVLIHLLRAVLGLVQGHDTNNTESSDSGVSDTTVERLPSAMKGSRLFGLASSTKKRDNNGGENNADDKGEANNFAPDSVTASLLIASLHLSSHLRNTAVSVLTDLLSDDGNGKNNEGITDGGIVADEDDDDSQSIQIEEAADDPLIEKDDPASGLDFGVVTATSSATDNDYMIATTMSTSAESLETKGLKRKAAAAAQIATLRHNTKQRLVEIWRGRVAFYSACCLLNMRILRMFMGQCVQLGIFGSSSDNMNGGMAGGEEQEASAIVSISAKTRLALRLILSNFHNTSASFQSLKTSVVNFYGQGDADATLLDTLQDQFLAVSLCNESLCLWGSSLPLLYPDHKGRVDVLGSMLTSLSSTTAISEDDDFGHDPSTNAAARGKITACAWTDVELQRLKLDIFCKRLRVSDMLDCFVAPPMVSTETAAHFDHGQAEGSAPTSGKGKPDNSLSTISLLSTAVNARSWGGNNNLTKLYLALCQRAISNLILWNDLSMSSNDANDHDISGGGGSSGTGSPGGSAVGVSLQLKANTTKFHFDSTKCADSISVTSSGSPSATANQRATKVWGTVLSTMCFVPKSGIHRWAIKLDKCERGHIFVGVSTARANLKTYVGGDSNGWGLIGTQALWHDRNKIRGDYGSTFRTGAVVVITLDTNVGTLSFGLWKDGASSSASEAAAASGGPLSPSSLMASPRRGSAPGGAGGGGPMIEDWGIAFEGLPLDVKLYPAVGLYQRDDRATLYTVSNSMAAAAASGGKTSLPPISSGDIYFPLAKDYHLSCVRSWNEALCFDGVSFATGILSRSIQLLSTDRPPQDDILLMKILPSLASSICLIPSCIPTLSAKYAMELLPLVTRCAKLLDRMVPSKDSSLGIDLKEGEWTICADSSTSSEGDSKGGSSSSCEEYLIHIKRQTVQGTDTKYPCYHGERVIAGSSSLNNHVSVIGASCGTHVQFIEEWCSIESSENGEDISFEDCAQRSTASYVIDARLSLDGTKFEGIRHNVEKGSAERITGRLQQPHSTAAVGNNWIQTESLLCLAVGHLSLILCSQTSLSDIDKDAGIPVAKESLESLLSASPILSRGRLDNDGSSVRRAIDSVWERCRSAEMYTDIVEEWQDSIYFDLFSATDASSTLDATKMKEAVGIFEQLSTSDMANQNGSLSRLCPAEYATARKICSSAIFYHTRGLRNDAPIDQSEATAHALQASLGIMENGIREALVCAEPGVPRREVCGKRCFLLGLVATFLFQFSSTPDDEDQPMQFIGDDIALIFKSIKSEDDLVYIKQQMNVRTEKSIMRYVGLRSLHLLLQSEDSVDGVKAHPAIESALVSLPRLLCPPSTMRMSSSESDTSTRLTSDIAGCAGSVQACFHLQKLGLYDKIGSILATIADQEPTSLVLGLLANYFTVLRPNEDKETILKMLPSLKKIVARCRDHALLPNKDAGTFSDTVLVNIVRKQENERLLRTSASVLLTTCAQLTRESCGSPQLVDLLSEHLLQEISETISFVAEDTKIIREREEVEAVQSDWAIYKTSSESKPKTNISHDKAAQLSKGLTYLSDHGTLSMKPTMSLPVSSSSSSYFGQLLNVFNVVLNAQSFIESITKRANILFSTFGFQLTGEDQGTSDSSMKGGWSSLKGLPLKFRRRILRLLRPILLSMEADPLIIFQLFHMAGSVTEVTHDTNGDHSLDEPLLAQSAISLLRYLYTFSKSWRVVIHQNFQFDSMDSSPSIFRGMLSFLGGAPGSLQPGAFVVIEPEGASSSSSAGSTKSRNSGSVTGTASNASTTSAGSGAEEIVAGLCRHNALSGVMSSVDPRTGSCEVIVLGNKSFVQLPPNTGSASCLGASKVAIRAVRVSSANISAADELPLVLDDINLPAKDIFSPLLDVMKSVSADINAISNTQDKGLTELETNANELMQCCLGLRSTAVLISEPKVLRKFVADESSGLRVLLAYALLMGSLQTDSLHGLSSLPSLEARVWHLLSVRSAVKSRAKTLDNTSTSSLKALFEDKSTSSGVTESSNSESKGLRTPPSASSGLFFGSERASRNSSTRVAATNNIREEDGSASSAAADQNNEEGDDESSNTEAAHLREAAIVQMAELGLPRQWAELALSRVGGTNIEAAVHFCLERGGDMERLLAEESERRGPSSFSSSRRRGGGASRMATSNLIRQLVEMGFPRHWCVEALSATRNNVDEALTWILTNGDRLSAEDEAAEEGQEDEDDNEDSEEEEEDNNEDDDDDDNEDESIAENNDQVVEDQPLAREKSESTQQTLSENVGWSGICPIRFVSGRSNINPKTLDITGLPNGGFSSVGTKGVLLTTGKWYYEAEIKTAGCLQIGWADSSFVGHCQAERGDGCGDGPSSWAFDGWRRYRWHSTATEWGCRWAEGDIIGCLVDMDTMSVSFTLNGKGEDIGMGVAFSGEGFRPCSGVYACVSFNRREKLRLILGGKGTEPFTYPPPDGYRGIGEAIHSAVKERDILLAEEKVLDEAHSSKSDELSAAESKKYMCDFSDGEHGHELFAWQHRYYGSDASVHLGSSSRPSTFGGSSGNLKTSKSSSVPTKNVKPTVADISSRLSKILSKAKKPKTPEDEAESFDLSINLLRDAYKKIDDEVDNELKAVCASLCVLYSQKLVMHTMVSHSNQFSLLSFFAILARHTMDICGC